MKVSQLTLGGAMATEKTDNRARLAQAAMKVAYRQGFGNAALAEIAEQARVPLGNVYYYFKTKDEIGSAIIDLRVSRLTKRLQGLDKLHSPKDRLCGFVQIKIDTREELARLGCPVGTLCSELHKHGGSVAKKATVLFVQAIAWLEAQFKALGKAGESRGLAVHLLAATQGISLLAHAFHDPDLIILEAARLKRWIREL
jgi:AcrR family transcriptional regulator